MNHIVVGPYDGAYFVAYQIPGSNLYQPVGTTMSEVLAKEEANKLNKEAKASVRRGKRKMLRRFDDWVSGCKADGVKPVPPDDAVFKYAEEIGLTVDFIRLAWMEFGRQYGGPEAKTYIDWNKHFQNAVRKNWFKLWFHNGDGWSLTTSGKQLEVEMKAKQKNEHRDE